MDWSIPIVVDDILFNPHLRWFKVEVRIETVICHGEMEDFDIQLIR